MRSCNVLGGPLIVVEFGEVAVIHGCIAAERICKERMSIWTWLEWMLDSLPWHRRTLELRLVLPWGPYLRTWLTIHVVDAPEGSRYGRASVLHATQVEKPLGLSVQQQGAVLKACYTSWLQRQPGSQYTDRAHSCRRRLGMIGLGRHIACVNLASLYNLCAGPYFIKQPNWLIQARAVWNAGL